MAPSDRTSPEPWAASSLARVPVPASSSSASAEFERARWLLAVQSAGERGPCAVCSVCGQLGTSSPFSVIIGTAAVSHWLRWSWAGRSPLGELVYPVRVTQARQAGTRPPWYCPDHEAQRIADGLELAPELPFVELERGPVRP